MSLFVKESYVNVTEGYRYGGNDNPYETACDTAGDLFRVMRREYGRCTGKVYVDTIGGPCELCHEARADHEFSYPANPITVRTIEPCAEYPNGAVGALPDPRHPGGMALQHYYQAEPKQVGWVFQARARYEDRPSQTYLREVWVTVVTGPDTVTRTEHYADLDS